MARALALMSCAVVAAAAVADEGPAPGVAGVWYGTYERAGSPGTFGMTARGRTVFYLLDLTVAGETVEGTFATGSATDTRTSRQRAMDALGLPGNEGPKASAPRPMAGVIDGKTLVLETTTRAGPPLAITAEVGANRMRAEVRTGQEQRTVLLRRCRPARNSAGDDCSLEALWEQYLRAGSRQPRSAPTPQEIQRANVPPNTPQQ